jgi:hypothetical protein
LVWKTLFIAIAIKPPGEEVAQKILITRSFAELRDVGFIAAFLLTQIMAIWYARSLRDPLADARAA